MINITLLTQDLIGRTRHVTSPIQVQNLIMEKDLPAQSQVNWKSHSSSKETKYSLKIVHKCSDSVLDVSDYVRKYISSKMEQGIG